MSEFVRKKCPLPLIFCVKASRLSFQCIWTIAVVSGSMRPLTTCISDSYLGMLNFLITNKAIQKIKSLNEKKFRILFRTLNHQMDYVFDWTIHKQKLEKSKKLWILKNLLFATAKEPIIVRVKNLDILLLYHFHIQL